MRERKQKYCVASEKNFFQQKLSSRVLSDTREQFVNYSIRNEITAKQASVQIFLSALVKLLHSTFLQLLNREL